MAAEDHSAGQLDADLNGALARLVRVCFRGEPATADLEAVSRPGTLDALERHGLLPLMGVRLGDRLSGSARRRAADARRRLAAQELVWDEELHRVITALARLDVPVLVIKGQALAYTHYPEPGLRPRCDMDLLIRPGDRRALDAAFEPLGYTGSNAATGEHTLTQSMFTRDAGGLTCVFDVHWQASNRPGLARAFPFDELMQASVTAGPTPDHRGLNAADALLLACAHRAGHHAGNDRWIWLYDVDLLCRTLSGEEWARFAKAAQRHRLGGLCRETLRAARSLFGVSLDPVTLRALDNDDQGLEYFRSSRVAQWRVDVSELRPAHRLKWVREHLLPDPGYMREQYSGRMWLPVLYLRRALLGLRRLFR